MSVALSCDKSKPCLWERECVCVRVCVHACMCMCEWEIMCVLCACMCVQSESQTGMSVALSCDRCKPCVCVCVCVCVCSLKVRQKSLPACDCHMTNINLVCVRERLWVCVGGGGGGGGGGGTCVSEWVLCATMCLWEGEKEWVYSVCAAEFVCHRVCVHFIHLSPWQWGHTHLLTVCPSPSVQILTPRWTTCTAPRVCSQRRSPAMPRPFTSTRSRPSSSSSASSWLRPWWTPGWSVRCWLC